MAKSWLEWRLLRPDGTPSNTKPAFKTRTEADEEALIGARVGFPYRVVRVRVTVHEPTKGKRKR
jgi:hypothetical protein